MFGYHYFEKPLYSCTNPGASRDQIICFWATIRGVFWVWTIRAVSLKELQTCNVHTGTFSLFACMSSISINSFWRKWSSLKKGFFCVAYVCNLLNVTSRLWTPCLRLSSLLPYCFSLAVLISSTHTISLWIKNIWNQHNSDQLLSPSHCRSCHLPAGGKQDQVQPFGEAVTCSSHEQEVTISLQCVVQLTSWTSNIVWSQPALGETNRSGWENHRCHSMVSFDGLWWYNPSIAECLGYWNTSHMRFAAQLTIWIYLMLQWTVSHQEMPRRGDSFQA